MRFLNSSIALAAVLAATLCGCDGPPDPRADLVDLDGVPVPDDWRAPVAASLDLLRSPAGDAPHARAVSTYYELHRDIGDPATRAAAGDSLFALWRADPTDFLWIELAAHTSPILGRTSDRDAVYAQLPDTTTAVGSFLWARRFWGFRSGAGRHFELAWDRRAELDPLQTLWLATRVAMLRRDHGRHDEAVALLRELLPTARRLGGVSMTGFYWFEISGGLRRAGRLDMALHAATLALACAEADGHAYMVQRAWLEVGRVLAARREHRPALDVFDTSLEASRRAGYASWARRALRLSADIHRTLGDLDAVLDLHRRALDIAIAARDTSRMIYLTGIVAEDFRRLGRLDSCRTYLRRADADLSHWANPRNRLGQTYQWAGYFGQTGDYARADSLHGILAGLVGEDGYRADMVEVQLALLRQGLETGRPDLAYRALDRGRALQASMSAVGTAHVPAVDLELAAAEFLAQQGEFRRAAPALDAAGSSLGPEGAVESRWRLELTRGEVAQIAGDRAAAARAFAAAVELASELGAPDLFARSRVRLGHALLEQGRAAEASALFASDPDAGDYWSRLAGHLFSGLAAARASDHEAALSAYDRAEAMLRPHAPRDLVARLHLERGRSLAAVGRPAAALEALTRARDLLRVQGERFLAEEYRAFHREANRELAEVRIGLLHDHPGLARGHGVATETLALAEACRWRVDPDASMPAAEDLAATVPPDGEPVLVLFMGRERSFAWTGSRLGWELTELPPTGELKRLVGAVLTDLSRPGAEVSAADVRTLGRMLLDPVAAHWRRDRPLRIVPDGPLVDLPWSALRLETGDLVLDHGPVVEAPDAAAAVRDALAPDTSAVSRLLVLGRDGAPSGEPALRHAEAEAAEIATVWPGAAVELRTGSDSRWSGLRDRLSGFDLIHIASHASVTQGLPGHSTLRLAGGDGEPPLTIPAVRGLELDAELVYLSSCETARLGADTGSGLNSFARAFLQAGARRVVAPTLRIEDAAARYLAASFHRHLQHGKSWAAALRAAQLDVRAADPDWRHPYYWSFTRILASGRR